MKNSNGNMVIGQSGGPTSVINSSLAGAIIQAKKEKNINAIYGMNYAIEGFMKAELIDLGKLSATRLRQLKDTPSSALGSSRLKLKDEHFPQVLAMLKKFNIRFFHMIGGNDSMDTINRIEKYCWKEGYNLNGVGIPKTVDNDLFGTDHTPGFPSAARFTGARPATPSAPNSSKPPSSPKIPFTSITSSPCFRTTGPPF